MVIPALLIIAAISWVVLLLHLAFSLPIRSLRNYWIALIVIAAWTLGTIVYIANTN